MTDVGPYPYEVRPSYDSYHTHNHNHNHHHRHRHFFGANEENEYVQSYANERKIIHDEPMIQRTESADSSSFTSAGSVGSVNYQHDHLSRFDKFTIKYTK